MIMKKYLEDPVTDAYGMNYRAILTDEFKILVDNTKQIIQPFDTTECSPHAWNFFINDDWCCENDTCDNEECFKESIEDIQKNHKDAHVEHYHSSCDGDNETIRTCCICRKPLNQYLCWNDIELGYLLSEKRNWCKKYFIDNAFVIMAILENTPSVDYNPSGYCKHQLSIGNKKPMQDAIKRRETFYNDIAILCRRVLCDAKRK